MPIVTLCIQLNVGFDFDLDISEAISNIVGGAIEDF
jgi:hypothetical protein